MQKENAITSRILRNYLKNFKDETAYVIMFHLELGQSNNNSSFSLVDKTEQQLTSFLTSLITHISLSGGFGGAKIFSSLLIVFCAFMHPEYNS
jgi:hypothetical protein